MQTSDEKESFSITQKKGMFRHQTFKVIEDRIEYSSKELFSINNFSVPLRDLDPQPARYRSIPIGWFFLLIILLIMEIVGYIKQEI